MQEKQELRKTQPHYCKQSDKGGARVVIDKDYYDRMMELPDDRENYQPLNENIDQIIMVQFFKVHPLWEFY